MAINKIPKQVMNPQRRLAVCWFVWMLNLSTLLDPLQPTPPLDPAHTKRTDSEPMVEKARLASMACDDQTTGSSRNPLEPRNLDGNRSEGQSSASEAQTRVFYSSGAGPGLQLDEMDKKRQNMDR